MTLLVNTFIVQKVPLFPNLIMYVLGGGGGGGGGGCTAETGC